MSINKKVIENIILHGLSAVDPESLILSSLSLDNNTLSIQGEKFDLNKYSKIHILGLGKGASFLYQGLEQILGDRIFGGIIITVKKNILKTKHSNVIFKAGSHPFPDENSLESGALINNYIDNEVNKSDLVIFLITGGASALAVLPAPGIKFYEIQELNKLLLVCGAEISEINCIRKHLSNLKGGRLAEKIAPAKVISLILSDIVNSPLEDIGSGPSVGDSSTFTQAFDILEKYDLLSKVSPGILEYIQMGQRGEVPDTPEPDGEQFRDNAHFLIGDNKMALTASKKEAEKQGIKAYILTSGDRGEASEVAKIYASIMDEIAHYGNPFEKPVIILCGGELTVSLKGKGKGGRNLEFVMHMLKELKGRKYPFYIISIGSDGIDGPTDAAGAWIDNETENKRKALGLNLKEYINNNDSYHLFKKLDQCIMTGPTRTNVMDLRLLYIP